MKRKTFSLTSPCPACQGYNGAYRKEKRCKGYEDERGIWCSKVDTETYISPFGVKLYLQELNEDVAPPSYPPTATVLEFGSSPNLTTKGNVSYSPDIPQEERINTTLTLVDGVEPKLEITEEVVEYPERPGPWGWKAHSEKWYVVTRGFRTDKKGNIVPNEIARDTSQLRLRGWFLEREEHEQDSI